MIENNVIAIILGAGKGTRMESRLPKVLHRICGIPMIIRVIDSVRLAGIKKIFVVIGYNLELIKTALYDTKVEFVEQKEQLGTAHAVLQAENELKDYEGDIFIINGDSPLVKLDSIKKLIKEHKIHKPAATILTSIMENPDGYGRIIRLNNNNIDKIVEDKDANGQEKMIKEINAGVYCFSSEHLFPALKEVGMDNAKGEMYLTDVMKIFRNKNLEVMGMPVESSEEAIGIDTVEKLQLAEEVLIRRELESKEA